MFSFDMKPKTKKLVIMFCFRFSPRQYRCASINLRILTSECTISAPSNVKLNPPAEVQDVDGGSLAELNPRTEDEGFYRNFITSPFGDISSLVATL
jgi:hypothetical protein